MQDIKDDLERYAKHKIPTGSFLQAVLEGDLFAACAKADYINCNRIFTIAYYIANNLPHGSYGSKETVEKWLNKRRTIT